MVNYNIWSSLDLYDFLVKSFKHLAEIGCLTFQHEAGCAAFEDARKQMENILGAIETKTGSLTKIQSDLERSKLEAMEARKVEQVRVFVIYT